ncbi:uncharacterized protein LOC128871912 isoform X1 [Anastrepha ludens]|uniref:uncharacterized protein LOC128871912 isoform X1 n=2 Tax=Anastrepha ludens TaxID=28586 RepID=UPI0023AF9A9B|nr:uncharacterized protein LOC128871912 isoform X1 [Anastrepha ludens]
MHRIPLLLPAPSVSWNRSEPDYLLFENTVNACNIEESDEFLSILDREANEFFDRNHSLAADQVAFASDMIHSGNLLGAIRILNNIILRLPKDCDSLSQALKIRGDLNLQRYHLQSAVDDYTMFLYLNTRDDSYEELYELHGNLTVCYYLMRQFDRARIHLRHFKKYKDKLPKETLTKTKIEKIGNHIAYFEPDLHDSENFGPKCGHTVLQDVPFQGFNKNADIKQMSSACYIKTNQKEKKVEGVFVNTDLLEESVVLIEKPISVNVNAPLVQCELCLHRSDKVYTCLDCRYKTYCSLHCIKKDRDIHQYECSAYKNLILFILDAKDLYRLFIKVSSHLHEHVFSRKVFRKLSSVETVLGKIEKSAVKEDSEFGSIVNLLRVKPSYTKLSEMQYSTLVVTAFRLALFIIRKTNLVDTFYKKLRIVPTHRMILIGVILMRLHCHLLLNTFDFEYLIPLLTDKPKYETVYDQIAEWTSLLNPVREPNPEDINAYFNTAEAEVVDLSMRYLQLQSRDQNELSVDSIPVLEHTQLCNSIERPVSVFKDKLAELYFNTDKFKFLIYGGMAAVPNSGRSICESIAKMPITERSKLVQKFVHNFHAHFMDYFLQTSITCNQIHQVLSLPCPTLRKFKHSCAPNVDIVILDNGMVMGRTMRYIKKDEELFVSYKAHYMRHTREERHIFLKQINIDCQCEVCQNVVETEPTNARSGIYCEKCTGFEITSSQGECTNCGINFDSLSLKYRTEIATLECTIKNLMNPESDERKLYLLSTIMYMRVKQNFVPSHETRIKAELQYAKYLALKNFSQSAYNILMEVKANIAQNYSEDALWLFFYTEMLLVIKIILYYNIEENVNPMPITYIEELCEFGIYIINEQNNHRRLLKTKICERSEIFEEMYLFLKWQEKLHHYTSLFNSHTFDGNRCTESKEEELPALLKVIQ